MTDTCFTTDQVLDRAARLYTLLQEEFPEIAAPDARLMAGRLASMDLDAFQAAWQRRKADFPAHLSITEGRIISRFLDAALADDAIEIEVHDERGVAVHLTRDRHAIEKETAATSETYYIVFKGGERQGFVWFVHGNETDVLTDHAVNPVIERLVAPCSKLAEELE